MQKSEAKDTITWAELRGFFGSFSKFILQAVKKYWYILVVLLLVTVGTYFLKTYFREKLFQQQTTVGFLYGHQKLYGQAIEELNYLVQKGDHEELNKRLTGSTIDWSHIRSIEAENLFGYKLIEDMGPSEFPFFLFVTGTNPSAVTLCSEAVVNYLNQLPFVITDQQFELNKLAGEVLFYEQQIVQVDSILDDPKSTYALNTTPDGQYALVSERTRLLELKDHYFQKRNSADEAIHQRNPSVKILSFGVIKEM